MRSAIVVSLILVVIGAFLAGRFFAPDSPEVPAATEVRSDRTVVLTPTTTGLSAQDVRAIVRAELERARPSTPETTEELDAPPPEELERRRTAFSTAQAVVSAAVNTGRWTTENARALRAVVADLGPEEMDQIMAALIVPANDGRLRVETSGSLLNF